jgi:hypothetical protein
MNKERLEWVMSGLNQYVLTTAEDHFLRTTAEDFGKNQALTEKQEERLETLYREKSKLIPNKKADSSSFKKGGSRKVKPRRPTGKYY